MLVVAPETADQPEVAALLAQADARSASLYPAESRHGMSVAALVAAEVRLFVARLDGAAVGCGGYAKLAAAAAEVKRLFVDPAARGLGVGWALMQAVERAAVEEGVSRLWLETGIKSYEALRLYRRLGFVECGPFGCYGPDPLSVFMVKAVPVHAPG